MRAPLALALMVLCASLSAQSLREPPTVAWRYQPRGQIDSPARALGSSVVIATLEGLRRGLHILDAETGRVLASRNFVSSRSLDPVCAGRTLVIHSNEARFDVLRFDGLRLALIRSLEGKAPFSSVQLLGDELVAREGDTVFLQRLDRQGESWRIEEGLFRGTPARSADHVYAVRYGSRGKAEVVALDARTGTVTSRASVGHHGGKVPDRDAQLSITVLKEALFVRHALPVIGTDRTEYNTVRVPLSAPGSFSSSPPSLHRLERAPADAASSWVGMVREPDGELRWIASQSTPQGWAGRILATPERHASLLAAPPDPVAQDGVLFLAGHAIDAEDFSVLWRAPQPPSRPLTIADRDVLLVANDRELICLRAPRPVPSPERKHALEREKKLEAELATAMAALAERALRTNDGALIERLTAAARERGAQARTLQRVDAGLERLRRASRPPRVDERGAEALATEARNLLGKTDYALVREARAETSGARSRALLRRVLERDPQNRDAATVIRSLAGKSVLPGTPFDPSSWLDYLDVRAHRDVRPVDPLAGKPNALPWTELGAWPRAPRGFRTERLLVATPPGRPGAVARALEVGEELADVLEELFPGKRSGDREPMALFLYGTRDDYIRLSSRASSLPEVALGWSAGHYSPSQNVSRMFVPEDDTDLAQFLGVYAHELTHHWLATRAPFTTRAQGSESRPGYWIVEGFANLIEELRVDPLSGRWEDTDPRAHSLDVLANAPDEALVPWRLLLTVSHNGFERFSNEREHPVALTWRLGAFAPMGEIQLFYAQAGAVCHYLFTADGGRHRAKLLDYVASWYTGKTRGLSIESAFGMAPDELGRRATEHALRTVRAEGR